MMNITREEAIKRIDELKEYVGEIDELRKYVEDLGKPKRVRDE